MITQRQDSIEWRLKSRSSISASAGRNISLNSWADDLVCLVACTNSPRQLLSSDCIAGKELLILGQISSLRHWAQVEAKLMSDVTAGADDGDTQRRRVDAKKCKPASSFSGVTSDPALCSHLTNTFRRRLYPFSIQGRF